MLTLREGTQVFMRQGPTDMRKSIDGLTALVVDEFSDSPQSGHLFLFCNKKKDKVKIIYWDRNGFVLHYKRLDKGRFKWLTAESRNLEITTEQLQWLLAGLDFALMKTFDELSYSNYY